MFVVLLYVLFGLYLCTDIVGAILNRIHAVGSSFSLMGANRHQVGPCPLSEKRCRIISSDLQCTD